MTMLAKLARITKPGMFTAALVGIAITAAATYTSKLAGEYGRALDDIEAARGEIDALETQRASMLLEIEDIHNHRAELLQSIRHEVLKGLVDDGYSVKHGESAVPEIVGAKATDDVNAE